MDGVVTALQSFLETKVPKRRLGKDYHLGSPSKCVFYKIGHVVDCELYAVLEAAFLVAAPVVLAFFCAYLGWAGLGLSVLLILAVGYRYWLNLAEGVFLPESWSHQKQNVEGRTVMITGCRAGMGRNMIKTMVEWKAGKIIITCRSQADCDAMKKEAEDFAQKRKSPTTVQAVPLELSEWKSVKSCADTIKSTNEKLDIFMGVAGVMMSPFCVSEGFEHQWKSNHLGHHYLLRQLMPLLRSSGTAELPSRVVMYSSLASILGAFHEFQHKCMSPQMMQEWLNNPKPETYDKTFAYEVSKIGQVLMCKYMQQEEEEEVTKLKDSATPSVYFYSLHPGCVKTSLTRHMKALPGGGPAHYLLEKISRSPRAGNQTALYCASAPIAQLHGGGFYYYCREAAPAQEMWDPEMINWLRDYSDSTVEKISSQI